MKDGFEITGKRGLRDDADMMLAVVNGVCAALLAGLAAVPGLEASLAVSGAPAIACFLLGAILAGCATLARGRPRRMVRAACMWLAALLLLGGLGLAVAAATGLLEIRLQFRGLDQSSSRITITDD